MQPECEYRGNLAVKIIRKDAEGIKNCHGLQWRRKLEKNHWEFLFQIAEQCQEFPASYIFRCLSKAWCICLQHHWNAFNTGMTTDSLLHGSK